MPTSAPTSSAYVTEVVAVASLKSTTEAGGAIFSGIKSDGTKVTVVASHQSLGRLPVVGESWRVDGDYREHPTYGRQLHARLCVYTLPEGRLISQFLANNPAFGGIGHTKASRLWEALGDDLGRALDDGDVAALCATLSDELAVRTIDAWKAKRSEAALVKYLADFGFDIRTVTKLQRAWGEHALRMLKTNPYLMLAFSGWKTVDATATKLGIARTDVRRLVGAVEAALYDRLTQSHTLTPHEELLRLVSAHVGSPLAERAIRLAIEELAVTGCQEDGYQAIGAAALERGIERRLGAMLTGEVPEQATLLTVTTDRLDIDKHIEAAEVRQGFALNAEQKAAVHMVMSNQFSLLTGGAGVGKTTVLNVVLAVAEASNFPIVQMALAGRAAKRMAETTGRPAMTIAKFLLAVRKGETQLPPHSLVVIDESSMIDLSATYRVLRELPDGCRLVLVGDPAQLPPIGFGLVFHRLVDTEGLPLTRLTQVHRQAASTGIPALAAMIRAHRVPDIAEYRGQSVGVNFLECSVEMVIPKLLELADNWQGEDFQILCATKKQQTAINLAFHDAFGGSKRLTGWTYAVGDPVIHLANDYERGLMNGTLGRIVDVVEGGLQIDFENEFHILETGELGERLSLAYAISVHKSQGSQFKRVAIVSTTSRIYDHALVYTALTRAVEQAVFVGERTAFASAVQNPPAAQRRQVGFRPAAQRVRDVGPSLL